MWYWQENEPYLERRTGNLNLQHVWEEAEVVPLIRCRNLTAMKRIVCCERSEMDVYVFFWHFTHTHTHTHTHCQRLQAFQFIPGTIRLLVSPPRAIQQMNVLQKYFAFFFYLRVGELSVSCLWEWASLRLGRIVTYTPYVFSVVTFVKLTDEVTRVIFSDFLD
jgi:hypothetical protein